MKTSTPTADCPKCKGHGVIPLSRELVNTLEAVRKLKRASAGDVAHKLDPTGIFHTTAFNNRLDFLERQGLLERHRESKQWIYTIK